MPFDSLFRGVDIAASGMSAERTRMEAAAENLAHAGATHKLANGLPYARQRVHFQEVLNAHGDPVGPIQARLVEAPRYQQRHDPDHPDADPASGMVVEADIDPILELTDMMVAQRSYQANANVVRGLFRMHEQALRLGEQ